jgi:hypothetical protein
MRLKAADLLRRRSVRSRSGSCCSGDGAGTVLASDIPGYRNVARPDERSSSPQ